ncbi:MAG: S8 family serine peptidase [Flavobacteriales bacterium]|nr:S8 family serine peptidase [Flavobacteriales bacterium]
MLKLRILIVSFFLSTFSFAQIEDAWVFFKDKPLAQQYVQDPSLMLSPKAIARRVKQNISIDSNDVPIYTDYISSVVNVIGNPILAKSKWMNAVHVRADYSTLKGLVDLPFVSKIEFANKAIDLVSSSGDRIMTSRRSTVRNKWAKEKIDYPYGLSLNQIQMLHGDILHQSNFTGEGVTIAVMDGGFIGVDTADSFKYIRDNQQIKGGYDFVNRSEYVYNLHDHGTMVLSTIAGYKENQLVGTAPNADFYLFITEDVGQETPLEESLWVEAAEYADSVGVDIINTSLGYTTFDNPLYDHSYLDMDGKTTFAARGLEYAHKKGILCVVSAGNDGDNTWRFIATPADSEYALTIGAVDANRSYASFSSMGPTSDGRIKPDVVAQGKSVRVCDSSDFVRLADGTSFSGPIMTGIAACVWQMFPDKTNTEIKDMIIESSDRYQNPDNSYGHGILDCKKIWDIKLKTGDLEGLVSNVAYTNPVKRKLIIYFGENENNWETIAIYNVKGRLIHKEIITKTNSLEIDVNGFSEGIYFFELKKAGEKYVDKFVKKL